MKISEIPYTRESAQLFSIVADEPWSMYLDSGFPQIDKGRYDIIVARPVITIETYREETRIRTGENEIISTEDPFYLLNQYLGETSQNLRSLPFCGGALGYFSYDLGRRIESLPEIAIHDVHMPDMAIGIYDWAVVIDHHSRRAWLASFCRYPQTETQWQELQSLFSEIPEQGDKEIKINSDVHSNMNKQQYAEVFDRVKHYILEGDCYQVNLAQRFTAEYTGNGWDVYSQLRQLNPAPFSAYINIPAGSILSSSPERFLKLVDRQVETKPIKGTRRRSVFAYEDKALADSLLESDKDRAENLMIVDLLRNDISKSCESGSVVVPKLFELETYATVHHLISTVSGRLKEDMNAMDLLRGCFPGGSVTGAPKLRSMEIIEELEPHRRSVYCGSIGYIGFDGNMDSNICIRTIIDYQDKLYFHAGGGIVWGSDMESEYRECFDKVAAMFKLFSTENVKTSNCH